MGNRLKQDVSATVAGAILIASVVTVVLVGWFSLSARSEAKSHPLGPRYCLSCHSDAKTLQAMKDKRGF